MTNRKCLSTAALAALAFGSAAWAADQTAGIPAPASSESSQPAPVVYFDNTPTTLTPAMYELDKTSFGKWLEANNISITGFGEFGYFYDASNPRMGAQTVGTDHGDDPTLIGFPGTFSNRGQLDQVDLSVSKTIDKTKKWDFGFVFENGYGTDDSQIHSDGVLDNRPFTFGIGAHPDSQYDIVQANASVLVPLGTGLTIEFGKFVTLLGYEYINPTENPFYTHSYLFTWGLPLTQTGVLGSYTFGKLVNGNDWTFTGGVTRGWNQSSRDNNDAADFLGEATGNITDKLGLTINVSEGPQATDDNKNYWTVFEVIPTYQVSDQLKLALDTLYADFPHGAATAGGKNAQWYSAAAYAGYKVNSYATVNARAEWYGDEGGFTAGSASAESVAGLGAVQANYYEGTLGVQVHPFPNDDILQWLQLRPEVRYDFSDRPVFNASHTTSITGAGDYTQFTAAMDVIMQF